MSIEISSADDFPVYRRRPGRRPRVGTQTCSVPGCGRSEPEHNIIRDCCRKHYVRLLKYGDPERKLSLKMTPEKFDVKYGAGAFQQLRNMMAQPCFTLEDMSRRFGVTGERVRQWRVSLLGIRSGWERQKACALTRRLRAFKFPASLLYVWRRARRHGLEVRPVETTAGIYKRAFHRHSLIIDGVECRLKYGDSVWRVSQRVYTHFGRFIGPYPIWLLVRKGLSGKMEAFVLPAKDLKIANAYVPLELEHEHNYRLPSVDWAAHREEWHLIKKEE